MLVTNDDGVWAPGIAALARALVAAGHDVVLAAPLDDRSGVAAAIGPLRLEDGIVFEQVELDGLAGVAAFGLDAPPALAVMAAQLGAFGPPPAIVASGINSGPNTGRSVLHSGTVGAALTAANLGLRAVAASLDVGPAPHWETAARLATETVRWLAGAPPGTVLNLNVPDLPLARLAGVRSARLARFGTVRAALTEVAEGRVQLELLASRPEPDAGSDTALVTAGWAAVTPLTAVTAGDHVDVAAFLEQGLEQGLERGLEQGVERGSEEDAGRPPMRAGGTAVEPARIPTRGTRRPLE